MPLDANSGMLRVRHACDLAFLIRHTSPSLALLFTFGSHRISSCIYHPLPYRHLVPQQSPATLSHVLHQTISFNFCFPRRGIGSREKVLAQLCVSSMSRRMAVYFVFAVCLGSDWSILRQNGSQKQCLTSLISNQS